MTHRTFDNPGDLDARLGLLDSRSEHAPKRHGTLKRKAHAAAKKKRRADQMEALRLAKLRKHNEKVRAYWSGATDAHPDK